MRDDKSASPGCERDGILISILKQRFGAVTSKKMYFRSAVAMTPVYDNDTSGEGNFSGPGETDVKPMWAV